MITKEWLVQDIEKTGIIKSVVQEMKGASVFVTGGTGLLGSMLVRTLSCISEYNKLGLKIYASVRDKNKAKTMFADTDNSNISFIDSSEEALEQLPKKIDFIIHTACPTKSDFFVNNPVETIQAIMNGTDMVLKMAKEKNVGSFVYLSSMEVYGLITDEKKLSPEDIGYLNNLSLRSSYPESKRLAELLCVSYHSEYGLPVKVIRLAQTFGPGIPKSDDRVFAQFIKAAVSGKDIVMHTQGASKRMYLDTIDAISAILTVLLKGKSGEVYNAGNKDNYCSVKEMAEMVISTFGNGRNKVIVDTSKDLGQYPPDNMLYLDVSLLEDLDWSPIYGLEDMYKRLLENNI